MVSEFAFAPQPEELKATAISAVNDGQLVMETTANYFNDAMHKEIQMHHRGEADWKYLFFPWFTHAAYQLKVAEDWTPSEEERVLMEEHGLTMEQLYWRNRKISKVGREKFKREYPASEEEAYRVTGNTYLNALDFEHTDVFLLDPDEHQCITAYDDSDSYAIGVDVSAGVGRDYSVIQVLSKTGYHQAYLYRSNTTTPVQLASIIIDIAIDYGNAKVLVESNNMGAVTIREMHHLGYHNLWKKEGKDWLTTLKSKTDMFEDLKKTVQQGFIHTIDNITHAELRAITVNEKGYIKLPEVGVGHGDSAVAYALAQQCLQSVKLPERDFLPDWVKRERRKRMRGKAGAGSMSMRRYK
jgi:hypothetical protein